MKVISVSISEDDYESFRKAATNQGRSIAQMIREAMALYRAEHLERRPPLREVPVLVGHKPVSGLPSRSELYDDIFMEKDRSKS